MNLNDHQSRGGKVTTKVTIALRVNSTSPELQPLKDLVVECDVELTWLEMFRQKAKVGWCWTFTKLRNSCANICILQFACKGN
jgi:hypothetical protein